jgi:hypothetical protein
MKRPKTPSPEELQRQVDEWNAKYPEGTEVTRYRLIHPLREPQDTRTRSAAWVMGGHTAMVMVETVGSVCLESVVPKATSPSTAHLQTFRKKPVVVQAAQYLKNSKALPKGVCLEPHLDGDWVIPHVHTIHQNQAVVLEDGDWILPEPDGVHFYPVRPDIFTATYEPTTMVVVTRWGQGGAPWLILKGTPEETRAEAVQYFDDDLKSLKGTLEEMSQQDFDNLGEFQG